MRAHNLGIKQIENGLCQLLRSVVVGRLQESGVRRFSTDGSDQSRLYLGINSHWLTARLKHILVLVVDWKVTGYIALALVVLECQDVRESVRGITLCLVCVVVTEWRCQ